VGGGGWEVLGKGTFWVGVRFGCGAGTGLDEGLEGRTSAVEDVFCSPESFRVRYRVCARR